MIVLRQKPGDVGKNERGFTLPEVVITIVLIDIVMARAYSVWFGVVERRAVDSAANQLASDMRLAPSSATNRLADWRIEVPSANSSSYGIGPSGGTLGTRTLPDDTRIEVTAATTIIFKPNGAAEISGGGGPFVVSSSDGDPDRTIELNTATSRTKFVG